MAQEERVRALMAAFKKTTYFKWMERQEIPIHDGYGVQDVRDLPTALWRRTGGNTAFINLYGMEGVTGMVVGEIPAGGALEAERHFYEEVIAYSKVRAPRRFGSKVLANKCLSGAPGASLRRRSIPGIA